MIALTVLIVLFTVVGLVAAKYERKARIQVLREACLSFYMEDEAAFREIVAGFKSLSSKNRMILARACEVAPSTVDKWARGTAMPGRHVRAFIVSEIRAYI